MVDKGESWLMMAHVDNQPSLDIVIMIIGSITIGTCKHHLPPLPFNINCENQLVSWFNPLPRLPAYQPCIIVGPAKKWRHKQTIKQLQQLKFAAMAAAKVQPGREKNTTMMTTATATLIPSISSWRLAHVYRTAELLAWKFGDSTNEFRDKAQIIDLMTTHFQPPKSNMVIS